MPENEVTTTAEMEENQTSESVAVLPDMSESLTSETEEASSLTTEHEAHPVAVATNVTSGQGVSNVQGVGGTSITTSWLHYWSC